MIRFILTILFSFFMTLSFAQKKEIAAARDNVKAGKNLEQVEKSMLKLLEDSTNRGNLKIYRLLNISVQKQYDQLNEKMYLKQSVDSAAFFLTLNRAFLHAFRTDSIFPGERKQYRQFLLRYLPNLNAGGSYFFRKEKFKDAYELFDTYLACKSHPIFEQESSNIHGTKAASFRALCCGYRLNDYQKTVKHSEKALLYKRGNLVAMKYLAETYQKNDSTYPKYVEMIDSGFVKYPCEEYFFTRLLYYQLTHRDYEKGLQISETAIAACPDRELYRYAKSHILLQMEDYEKCISAVDSTLAVSDSIADSYYIAGIANFYLAEQLQENSVRDKDTKEKMLEYYTAAMTYMEKYRKREPERKDKWGSPLYNIYLNLNMGTEFDEINQLLRNVDAKATTPKKRRR